MENNHPDKELFLKYLHNQCTPQEVSYLLHYFNAAGNQEAVRALIQEQLAKTAEEETGNENSDWQMQLSTAYAAVIRHIHAARLPVPGQKTFKMKYAAALRIAAVFLAVLLTAATGYLILKPRANKTAAVNTAYTQYILLPDGSKVIVHANSKLEYPEQFSGNTSQVTLTGEAYFDIKRNADKPFVIHTGKLKTTVLGTAFNIKAYPEATDITVTVTRGKVKVEDDHKILGVLTPDKQLVYSLPQATAQKQAVIAANAVKWTRENMSFESVSFESITEQIGKRYQANIRFANSDIKNCPVTASFSGTETLDEVISFLCLARNATYTKSEDNTILIDGKGCSD